MHIVYMTKKNQGQENSNSADNIQDNLLRGTVLTQITTLRGH